MLKHVCEIISNNLSGNSQKALTFRVMSKHIGSPLFPTVQEHINAHHHDTNLARLVVERILRTTLYYKLKKENISQIVASKRQLFRKQLQLQGY